MPTRTAFLITIGDVIESGPPQTRSSTTSGSDNNRNSKRRRNSSSSKSNGVHCNGYANADSDLTDCSDDEVVSNGNVRKNMKSRHISASSSSSMTNGNTYSQTLQRKRKIQIKPEDEDDEISFGDPAFESANGFHGKEEVQHRPGPACSKRKRKSLTEKFLEDNDSYYGIQLRQSKKSESSDCPPGSPLTNGRSRHNSNSVISNSKRQRLTSNCSSTNEEDKRLRINIRKIDEKALHAALSGISSGPEDDDDPPVRRTRKSKAAAGATSSGSNSPGKRRSELDKLLEAGSSSFHFETARETAHRLGLGPIHVDVKSTDSSDQELDPPTTPKGKKKVQRPMPASKKADALAKRNQRLLKKVSPAPKKTCPRPTKKVIETDEDDEEDEDEDIDDDDMSAYLSEAVQKELDHKLADVDGAEVEISYLTFSFERTPVRESWFETYTRQDKGDEIVYYPEPKSFPMPYEMPLSTFYPRKDPNRDTPTSTKWSKRPSGTATPEGRGTRGSASNAQAIQASQKLQEVVKKPLKLPPVISKLMQAQQADRKSPRCHASTKSLISSVSLTPDEIDPESSSEDKKPSPSFTLDECSNDSCFGRAKPRPPATESMEQLKGIEANLDSFLTEIDPILEVERSSSSPVPPEERKKRQSSDKPHRHNRHKHRTKRASSKAELIDHVVAANVDQVLLDCLEDELPSVTFPDEIPGSSPLELIENYHTCTSMKLGTGRWLRPTRRSFGSGSVDTSRKNSLVVSDDEEDNQSQNSTILKRLLLDGPENPPPKKVKDYSSSDTNSICSSTTNSSTSSVRKKKRKRNLTGFPNPKKKKVVKSQKLLTTVLKQNLNAKKNMFAKDRIQQAKKVMAKKQAKKLLFKKPKVKRGRKALRKEDDDDVLAEDEISVTDTDTEKVTVSVSKKSVKKRASPKGAKARKVVVKDWPDSDESEEEVLPVSTKRGTGNKAHCKRLKKSPRTIKIVKKVKVAKPTQNGNTDGETESDHTDADEDSEPEDVSTSRMAKKKTSRCKRTLRTRKRTLKKTRKY